MDAGARQCQVSIQQPSADSLLTLLPHDKTSLSVLKSRWLSHMIVAKN